MLFIFYLLIYYLLFEYIIQFFSNKNLYFLQFLILKKNKKLLYLYLIFFLIIHFSKYLNVKFLNEHPMYMCKNKDETSGKDQSRNKIKKMKSLKNNLYVINHIM